MEINTTVTKEELIKKLQEVNVFLANHQKDINPEKFVELQDAFEKLENKMRAAFFEDDKMTALIDEFKKEFEEQKKYIKKQENRIEKMKAASQEEQTGSSGSSELPSDILTV